MIPIGDHRGLSAFRRRWRANAPSSCLLANEDCKGPLIRSHSVQNAIVLDSLAEAGHVVTFESTPSGFGLASIGRNAATTFSGFCAVHDQREFRAIDFATADEFDAESSTQAAQFAYRAAAREYCLKLTHIRHHAEIVELARAGNVAALQSMHGMTFEEANHVLDTYRFTLVASITGATLIRRRLQDLCLSLRAQLLKGRFQQWRFFRRPISGIGPVAASGGFYVEHDLKGRVVGTRAMHEDTPTIVLNVMPLGDQTWVLLAHHRRFDGRLGRMLLDLRDASESEFGQFMTRMLVVHCENTVFRPSFIAGLSEAERAKLVDAFGATMIDAPPFDEVDVKSFFGMVAD